MSDLNYFGSSDTVGKIWDLVANDSLKVRLMAWTQGTNQGRRDEALEKYVDEIVQEWHRALRAELGIKN